MHRSGRTLGCHHVGGRLVKRSFIFRERRETNAINGCETRDFPLGFERGDDRASFDRELFPDACGGFVGGTADGSSQVTPPRFTKLCAIAATVLATTFLATAVHTNVAVAASPGQGGSPQQQPSQRAPGDGEAPPPARELTPAEIGALQTMMTNRAITSQLTPANAEALRRMMMETQGMTPPAVPGDAIKPHPRRIDVDPQVLLEQPESLKLALGVVTPITFLDSSGRPWPVEAVAFDPRMLAQDGNGCGSSAPPNSAVQGAGERPSTITMMPCRINTFGNVSIKLEGYALPVILMAKSSGTSGEVDLPVTVYVRGRSPSSQPMPAEAMAAYSPPPATTRVSTRGGGGRKGRGGDRGPMLPDRYLDTFGAGAPPANAQRVDIDDPSVSGWILDGKLYLRGAVTVINPAQDAMAESVGGVKVWRFDHPVPRILIVDESGNERDLTVTF